MFDLGITEEQEVEQHEQKEENKEENQDKDLPLYKPAIARKKDFTLHPYNLRPRDRKVVNTRTILVSMHL